jgi:predicted transcriptional regulator
MPKTRYDFEEQHKSDVFKILELENMVKNLKSENTRISVQLNEKINKLEYLLSMVLKVLMDKNQSNSTRNAGDTSPGRTLKLTEDMTEIIRTLRSEGKSQREIAVMTGLSPASVNKACKSFETPQA